MNAAIHVAFSREVHDSARLVLGNQATDELGIGDVTLDELVLRIPFEAREILEVAGIGQCIEINNRLARHRRVLEPL